MPGGVTACEEGVKLIVKPVEDVTIRVVSVVVFVRLPPTQVIWGRNVKPEGQTGVVSMYSVTVPVWVAAFQFAD